MFFLKKRAIKPLREELKAAFPDCSDVITDGVAAQMIKSREANLKKRNVFFDYQQKMNSGHLPELDGYRPGEKQGWYKDGNELKPSTGSDILEVRDFIRRYNQAVDDSYVVYSAFLPEKLKEYVKDMPRDELILKIDNAIIRAYAVASLW
jgi:hypothetical protein